MTDFPLLRGIFGVPVAQIDAAAIERAVDNGAAENDQLDWKQVPYAKGEGGEIAKDLAALANHRGGIIVIGVADDEQSHAATGTTPVTIAATEVGKQVRQAAASNIQPFLTGFSVRQTDTASGGEGHYVIIEVAPSRDAPHALIPGGPNGRTLSYPVRNGAETRFLKEFEVAVRYRDRAASRADLDASLLTTHTSGIETMLRRQQTFGDWVGPGLSVAAVPVNGGSRPPGAEARKAETAFLTAWDGLTNLPWHHIDYLPHHGNYRSQPAPQRTAFTTPDTVVELGHRGAGFICHALSPLPHNADIEDPHDVPNGPYTAAVLIPAERIEWALFVAINFLMDHAVDTGASGEVELRAQLHFAPPGAGSRNGGICTRIEGRRRSPHYEIPAGARLSPTTTGVQTTTTISDSDDPHRVAAIASFFLAEGIFAEFGIDDPHIFTPLGEGVPGSFGSELAGLPDWLRTNLGPL